MLKQTCEICGKKHQYIKKVKIDYQGKKLIVDEIHSPCLDRIVRLAVGALNRIVKK